MLHVSAAVARSILLVYHFARLQRRPDFSNQDYVVSSYDGIVVFCCIALSLSLFCWINKKLIRNQLTVKFDTAEGKQRRSAQRIIAPSALRSRILLLLPTAKNSLRGRRRRHKKCRQICSVAWAVARRLARQGNEQTSAAFFLLS